MKSKYKHLVRKKKEYNRYNIKRTKRKYAASVNQVSQCNNNNNNRVILNTPT